MPKEDSRFVWKPGDIKVVKKVGKASTKLVEQPSRASLDEAIKRLLKKP